MSGVYDNWDKLVGAVIKREELRRLALCESFSTSISADFSFDSSLDDVPPAASPIQFEEIKKAIKKYRPVEHGGLGVVWKGWIDEHTLTAAQPASGMAVAVQWNHGSLQHHQEWLKEIKYLSQLHHPNLLRFMGHCLEEDNMISVYEFMPRSLDIHLFRHGVVHEPIFWEARIKVATDVARGLSFLHEREIPVIHRDIRTANILLEGDFNAKLANFSLAIDGPTGEATGVSTQVLGTYGYVAPEYVATGWLTTKCDVYSFGVVLLELLSGRRVLDQYRPKGEQYLVEWAIPYLGDKRRLLRIMDNRLVGQYSAAGAYKVAKLASRCVSSDPKQRPRMDEIVVALQQL